MTCDTWHVTLDMWHVTHDTWQVGEGWPSRKIVASQLLLFGSEGILKIWRKRLTHWLSQLINEWQRCLQNNPGYTGSVKYSIFCMAWVFPSIFICFRFFFIFSNFLLLFINNNNTEGDFVADDDHYHSNIYDNNLMEIMTIIQIKTLLTSGSLCLCLPGCCCALPCCISILWWREKTMSHY